MANAPTTPPPAPPAEGRTIHLTVRDGRGGTTLVPILVRPATPGAREDIALARLGVALTRQSHNLSGT